MEAANPGSKSRHLRHSRDSRFQLGPLQQGPHVADTMCNAAVGGTDQAWDVVRDGSAVEADLDQGPHDRVHVHIAVIQEGLGEAWQGRVHIAEMDLKDLAPATEVADGIHQVLAHEGAAFEPAAAAQTDADAVAVGDLQGATIALKTAEDAARHSAEFGHRGIVGMDADAHAQFLRYWCDSPDEVREVVPDLFGRVLAPVREGATEGLALPVSLARLGLVENAGGRAAYQFTPSAPNAITHVGIGCVGQAGSMQVAQIPDVLLDLPVAPRQVEGYLFHVMHVGVADIPDVNTGRPVAGHRRLEDLGCGAVRAQPDGDVPDAQLPHETQVFVARLGWVLTDVVHLHSQLDTRAGARTVFRCRACAHGDSQGGARQHAGQHGPADVPARDITGSRASFMMNTQGASHEMDATTC